MIIEIITYGNQGSMTKIAFISLVSFVIFIKNGHFQRVMTEKTRIINGQMSG